MAEKLQIHPRISVESSDALRVAAEARGCAQGDLIEEALGAFLQGAPPPAAPLPQHLLTRLDALEASLAALPDTLETLMARPFNIWLFFVHCCLIENKTQLAGGDKDVVGQRICPFRPGAAHLCHGPWRVRAPTGRRSD